jgi:hypothetical protein
MALWSRSCQAVSSLNMFIAANIHFKDSNITKIEQIEYVAPGLP